MEIKQIGFLTNLLMFFLLIEKKQIYPNNNVELVINMLDCFLQPLTE